MKKYITKAFLATIILAGMTSCDKEEDRVFDKSVAERLSEQEQKLQDLLLSSDYGWKLVYDTAPGELGRFTYLINFKDSRNVEMLSDFSASGVQLEMSEYKIQQRATTSLVFTTRTKIHELSDPINSPIATGEGYFGEYQFGYYGNTENEIYFRTAKSDDEVTFVKATKEDWDTFNQQYTMVDNMNSLSKPYFRVVDVELGGKAETFDFTNSTSTRTIDLQGNDLFKDNKYALTYNTKGFTVTPVMEVGGQKITSFLYDEVSDSFIGKEGDVKVSFKYSNRPVVWTDMSYKKLLSSPTNLTSQFLFSSNSEEQLYSSRVTSEYFKQQIAAMGKNSKGEYNLEEILFVFNANIGLPVNANYVRYYYKGKQYTYFFLFQDLKDRVKVIPIQWNDASTVPTEIKDLNTKIVGDELYIRNEKFRIKYGANPVGTFISTNAPIAFPMWNLNKPFVFN